MTHAGGVGIATAHAREPYRALVPGLPPDSSVPYGTEDPRRSALKAAAREFTPPEVLEPLAAMRSGLGPTGQSGGRANIINPAADRVARLGGIAGRGLMGANALLGVADIIRPHNRPRTAMANAGAMAGGWFGGIGGGLLGGLGGPAS